MRLVLSAAVITALVMTAVAGGAAGHGSLRLVAGSPVIVAGSGFASGARLAVSYRSGTVVIRRSILVRPNGGFRVAFPAVFDRCKGATLQARRATTTLVSLTLLPCSAVGGRPQLLGGLGGMVRGVGFLPYERFALTAKAGTVTSKFDGTADEHGSFTAQLKLARVQCAELFFDAVGSLGSEAKLSLPAPDCKAP